MRKDKIVVVPKANTSKTFIHDGPRSWYSLSNELRNSVDYGQLRKLIRKWNSPLCNYSLCR